MRVLKLTKIEKEIEYKKKAMGRYRLLHNW